MQHTISVLRRLTSHPCVKGLVLVYGFCHLTILVDLMEIFKILIYTVCQHISDDTAVVGLTLGTMLFTLTVALFIVLALWRFKGVKNGKQMILHPNTDIYEPGCVNQAGPDTLDQASQASEPSTIPSSALNYDYPDDLEVRRADETYIHPMNTLNV